MSSAADKIKNFFKKKKNEAKFKLAGPGRRLDGTNAPSTSKSTKAQSDVYVPPQRKELTSEAKTAAEAAVARIQSQKKDDTHFNTSLAAIRAQVQRELEAERKTKTEIEKQISQEQPQPKVLDDGHNRHLAAQGVYFRCPMVSDEVLPRNEWKIKIKEFLYEQLAVERGLTSCLIILNCNTKEKSAACIETLTKYLQNIIQHPDEEKYRKIRQSNRIFGDKVLSCEGALDFLLAAGFTEQTIDDEQFFIYSDEHNPDGADALNELLEALQHSEIIPLELDRNIQVLLPSQTKKSELPPDFYRISPEELKREQQLRTEALENASILKTKAMREREELRYIQRYKFALVRVRFPDGVYLQGTFSVYEKLDQIYAFVQSCLKNEALDFKLMSPIGTKWDDDDMNKTLFDLRLVPNTILTFVACENEENIGGNYLKEDLLMLIQPV
ncbi:UBX domain-containing protein 6 [Sitodiplosis mosellana]|uniref:UBX domain-containing protein 6 n=1 Tax=Sitodiplosis mosellana TaxID=263140 RepID=UPI002444E7D8|nr:UBX domain-containing protein 6 [Sitodiplosis mosellana]